MNSSELKGYLTGLILGDGSIDKGVTKRSFNIKNINQDFIEKIYKDLQSCTNFKFKRNFVPEHYSHGCNHKDYWEISIIAHPYFAKKYHHFYDDNRRRTVSKEALNWLTPNGLANWYMSDGYVCLVGKTKGNIYNRRIDFCTDRYPKFIVERMQNALKENFGIITSLSKRGETYRLRIACESYEKFIWTIKPYITFSFQYKLYLGYQCQPLWMSDELWKFQENLRSATTPPSKVEG